MSRPEERADSVRILVASHDDACVVAVRGVLASQMSGATCDRLDEATLRSRPSATALVVDGADGGERAAELARRARAMGFVGGILLIGENTGAPLSDMGVVAVEPGRLAHDLVPAIAAALEQSEMPLNDQVMRARRLVAAGEIALHLQHDINNPLAGLLAELQLMELDPLAPVHAEAVKRMLTICRRLIAITHSLDGIGERKS